MKKKTPSQPTTMGKSIRRYDKLLKYIMQTTREDASIDFKEKLAEITIKKQDPKFHRFL